MDQTRAHYRCWKIFKERRKPRYPAGAAQATWRCHRGSPLPVARKEIEHQITRLEWEEQKQRGKIRLKISEMKVDIERMIDNPAYPDGLKEILRGVSRNLENDLKNIDLGVKLSSLSFVTDADEITGIQDISTDAAEPERVDRRSRQAWQNRPAYG